MYCGTLSCYYCLEVSSVAVRAISLRFFLLASFLGFILGVMLALWLRRVRCYFLHLSHFNTFPFTLSLILMNKMIAVFKSLKTPISGSPMSLLSVCFFPHFLVLCPGMPVNFSFYGGHFGWKRVTALEDRLTAENIFYFCQSDSWNTRGSSSRLKALPPGKAIFFLLLWTVLISLAQFLLVCSSCFHLQGIRVLRNLIRVAYG